MARPVLRVVHGGRRNIFDVLLLEEAVMRADHGNWLVQLYLRDGAAELSFANPQACLI